MKKLLLVCLLLIINISTLSAQSKTVSGKVTGADDGLPLPGVTVKVKGTAVGVQTNGDGAYSVKVPQGSTVLQFSYLGYTPQEINIGDRTAIDVKLTTDTRQLSEVVVTANNIRREARSLGFAVSTVNNEELTRGKDRSVLNSLQGKVAGVQISNGSGGVGSSSRVVIRGGTSLTGNNQALFVIDGIPIDNSAAEAGNPSDPDNLSNQSLNNQVDAGNRANDINPEDIESVTILKGPAAAALYGSRASNGAVLITTKSGKSLSQAKKFEVTYSNSFSLENVLRLPDFQNQYGQGGQKARDTVENFSWGPRYDGKLRPWGQAIDGQQRIKPYAPLPDNVKDFFNTGTNFTNNLSLGRSNEQSSYYFSYSNTHQEGVMPGTEYKRTSFRLSGTAQLANKFTSSGTINYIRSNGDLSVQGQGFSPYDQIIQTPRDIPIKELKDYKNKFNDLNGYYGKYTVNPYYYLGEDSYKSKIDRVIGNIQLGYKPLNWLDITYRIGTDFYTDKRAQIVSKRIITGEQNAGNADDGKYEEATFNVRELTSDLMATAKRQLTKDLSLSLLVGHNLRQRNSDNQISTANSLVIPFYYNLGNVDGSPTSTNFSDIRRLIGVYGSADLNYKNYLFLTFTGRNDWSSTLPKSNNSFFYPSISASFIITEALKVPDNVISFAKLRASVARVGNDAGPYLLQSVFVQGSLNDGFTGDIRFPLNGIPGFSVGDRIANPELKPEITQAIEFGLDMGFWQDRIGFEATYYSSESRNQIINVPLPSTTGYTNKTLNAGLLTNKGFELLLRATPVSLSNGFKWEISTNFTRNKSLVKRLFPGVTQIALGGLNGLALVAQEGQPYGTFFGNDYLLDPQGRIVVDGTTGYPIVDPNARILGNIQPRYLAGMTNTITFKGFSLSAVLDLKEGGKIYSRTKTLGEFTGTAPSTLYNDREPFVLPNSVIQQPDGSFVPNTTVKVQNAQDYWTNHAPSPLIDASFIKLREVSISYRFPKMWLNKTPLGDVSIGLTGRNLWLKTPKENKYIDPEASSFGNGNVQGYEYGTIPSIRSFGANIRVTF